MVFLLLAIGLVFIYLRNNVDWSTNNLVEEYVEELNKQVPIQEDRYTQLDTIVIPEDKTVRYYYTLSDELFADNDVRPEQVRLSMRPIILRNLKGDKRLRELREADVIFQFIYKAESGVEMMDFNMGPEEYAEAKK